jgi:DNA-binding MarR family transcriptional regulator
LHKGRVLGIIIKTTFSGAYKFDSRGALNIMKELYFSRYYGLLYRKTQLYFRAALADRNMSFSEAIVLMYVYDNPGTIQDNIASGLSIDKSAVARSIKSLVALGFLTRTEDVDNQRVKKVNVTNLAEELKVYLDKAVDRWNQIIFSDLTPEERTLVVRANYKMKETVMAADIQKEIEKIK